eukprot:m.309648 g.309648  ORF g.309648 m.309648 type:complete len:564 (+) comp20199_c0_seq48:343-2034(+)
MSNGLGDLPIEMLEAIFLEYLELADLRNLSGVSKACHAAAHQIVAYRNKYKRAATMSISQGFLRRFIGGVNIDSAHMVLDAWPFIPFVIRMSKKRKRGNFPLPTLKFQYKNIVGLKGTVEWIHKLKDWNSTTEVKSIEVIHGYHGKSTFDCVIQDVGAHENITHLYLRHIGIGVSGAAAVAGAVRATRSLLRVDLEGNGLGDGAAAIADALGSNATITTLLLANNNISATAGIRFAQALTVNSTLKSLDLSRNLIGDPAATAMCTALKCNTGITALNLSDNHYTLHDDIQRVTALAQALAVNTTVNNLCLCVDFMGNGAEQLGHVLQANNTVKSLNLWWNRLGSADITSIATALTVNDTICNLSLGNNMIGDDGAVTLFEALKKNMSIKVLNVSRNRIGRALCHGALEQALAVNCSIVHLDLGCNSLGDAGAVAVAKGLTVNCTIRTLCLSWNSVGDVGAVALADALKKNCTITALDVQECQVADAGATAIASALVVNKSLRDLNLKRNMIDDAGVIALAAALKSNKTIAKLNLVHNYARGEGIAAMITAWGGRAVGDLTCNP